MFWTNCPGELMASHGFGYFLWHQCNDYLDLSKLLVTRNFPHVIIFGWLFVAPGKRNWLHNGNNCKRLTMPHVQDFPSTVHWYKPWWSHDNCHRRGDKSYPASRWTCSGFHRQWSGCLLCRWTLFLEVYSDRSRSSRSMPCHSPHIHTTLGLRRHQVEVIFWAGRARQWRGCFPGE